MRRPETTQDALDAMIGSTRFYVAWHPDHPEAFIRMKGPKGLAEWRDRSWLLFPTAPNVQDVTTAVLKIVFFGDGLNDRIRKQLVLTADPAEPLRARAHGPLRDDELAVVRTTDLVNHLHEIFARFRDRYGGEPEELSELQSRLRHVQASRSYGEKQFADMTDFPPSAKVQPALLERIARKRESIAKLKREEEALQREIKHRLTTGA